MIDYATLRVIWWVLMGVLLCGFAVMDGFDLGVAALLPVVAKTDLERRVAINTVAPVWEGNQVWLILGGGVLFAAWPFLYAVSFSGFYLAMFLVLLTLIVRPVGFKFRSKLTHSRWRASWDWALSIAGFLSALTFGVAVGNVLQGVPFHFDDTLRSFYTGSFFALFNPFALLCGLVSVAMLLMHGALYLSVKVEAPIRHRAIRTARLAAVALVALFVGAGCWVAYFLKGYTLTGQVNPAGFSNPLGKSISLQTGAWMMNYTTHPWFILAPAMGIGGAFLALLLASGRSGKLAFLASSISVFGVVATVGVSMFPFLLPSSSNPGESLLIWDASASQLSLMIMLICAIIFLPIILAYTTWVYRVMRGKVRETYIKENEHGTY